jgi:hypothetical protein
MLLSCLAVVSQAGTHVAFDTSHPRYTVGADVCLLTLRKV